MTHADINARIADLDAMVVATIKGVAITRGDLAKAFKAVEPRDNWKNPIDARLTVEEILAVGIAGKVGGLTMIEHAVEFFTGSKVEFTEDRSAPVFTVCARAAGYYVAIGA